MPTKRFNLNTDEFNANRSPIDERFPGEARGQQELENIELPENTLLTKAEGVAAQMLEGEIPLDVQQQIEQITAENALQSGLGLGEAARNLTARDLGRTSLDIATQGIGAALQISDLQERSKLTLADINTRREMFNEDLNVRFRALEEQSRQWEDQFAMMQQQSDQNIDGLNLSAMSLISDNQRFMFDIMSRMTIANSQKEIAGLQANLDQISSFFNTTNEGIARLSGLET